MGDCFLVGDSMFCTVLVSLVDAHGAISSFSDAQWWTEALVTKAILLFSLELLAECGTVTSSRKFLRGFPRDVTMRDRFGEDIKKGCRNSIEFEISYGRRRFRREGDKARCEDLVT